MIWALCQRLRTYCQKSGKAVRSNGNRSRRSRVAHMEATLNVTREVNIRDVPKKLGPYYGKYNISGIFVATTSVNDKIGVLSGTNYDEELSDQNPTGSSIDLVKSTLKLIFHHADPFLLNNLLKFTDLILHSKVNSVVKLGSTMSEDSIDVLPQDGAGISLNIANHEPQHWSYFQKMERDDLSNKDASHLDESQLAF
ncbi:hypothetical protein Tco_0157971 [Tanacetum coccineum]